MSKQETNPPPLAQLLRPGLEAVARYWRPFVLLQGLALLAVVGYFRWPAFHQACLRLSEFRQETGLWFTAAAAALAGAVLPEAAKTLVLGQWRFDRQRRADLAYNLLLFAVNGIITDYQYRMLGFFLGTDSGYSTVLKKTLADQFITTPIYGVPYWIILYALRQHGFNWGATLRELWRDGYVRRVLPLLIPAWCFWIPMVTLIYLLPGPLQFVLFALGLAAWSLIMVFVANRKAAANCDQPLTIGV